MAGPDDASEARATLLRLRGVIRPWHDALLNVRPASVLRYIDLIDSVDRSWPFTPSLLQLMCVAGDAVLTHIAPEGIELHARLAIQAGASPAQVLEALEIATICGARTLAQPASALPGGANHAVSGELAEKVRSSRERFTQIFGSLPDWLERQFAIDPGYASALVDLSYAPSQPALSSRDRVLICFGVCACPAVLDPEGASFFAKAALRHGVEERELDAIRRVMTLLGLHSISYGILPATAGMETKSVAS
ncbi:hypothetical protein CMV14_07370 [Rhizorhabdus dicambivorans]|nr:hypothetical protein CMV14_07370 [Rhizorhabdus dicambivorans]